MAHLRLSIPSLPDHLVVDEILVRLPAKAVLRFRAACRAWRRDTSTPNFLRAYYDRRASLPLVSFYRAENRERALDTFDVLAEAEQQRRPVLAFSHPGLDLCDSCDGLLLIFYHNRRYNICNPATRQWRTLPGLTGAEDAWLYSSPSADGGVEYRVLFWKGTPAVYNVLTVGSSAPPRRVDLLPEAPKEVAYGIRSYASPAVLFNGALHWVGRGNNRLIVFDTAGETFREMRSPAAQYIGDDLSRKDIQDADANLFEAGGTFGMSLLAGTTVKVWVLQNYQTQLWTLRLNCYLELHVVNTLKPRLAHIVLSNSRELLVRLYGVGPTILIHCDAGRNLVKKLSLNSWTPSLTGHWFKESIVRHSFFQGQGGRSQPPFFIGL